MDNGMNTADREIFQRVHALLSSWAERGLTEVEAASLEALLRSSEKARDVYFDYIQDTVFLATLASRPGESGRLAVSQLFICDLIDDFNAEQEMRRRAEEAAMRRAREEEERHDVLRQPATRKVSPVVVAWAAVAVCVALMFWLTSGSRNDVARQVRPPDAPLPPAMVATIANHVGSGSLARLAEEAKGEEVSSDVGTRLTVGTYSLPDGFLELRFDSGPLSVIQGPAKFELWAKNGMELGLGKAVTKVPPAAKGFAVSTSTASIIDLGTEFAVAAGDDGSTEVLVLDGKVTLKSRPLAVGGAQDHDPSRADSPAGQQAPPYEALLTAGNARLVNASRAVEVIENPNRSKFMRSLDGLVAVDDFEATGGDTPLGGGFGFEDDWEPVRDQVDLQQGNVLFSGKGDASMRRSIAPLDITNKPIYFSAEFQISGGDPVCSSWLVLTSAAAANGRGAVIGLTDGQFTARLFVANNEKAKQIGNFGTFTPGSWHFLVGRLEANASGNLDKLSIWVDPSVDMPGDPQKEILDDLGYTEIDKLSVMFWDFGDGENSQGGIDNVRVGTSWAAVQ